MKTVGEEIMSFDVSDLTDLVRLLEEQPSWRAGRMDLEPSRL